jgi:3-hydroxyacyl-CoA dehydrogenase / 3-hydroxy-2-methylbutyryl-CoA dehydrogenase
MNEGLGAEAVNELGSAARFFACNVLETDNIAAAVKGVTEWIRETGKPLGGIIPAAGVGLPATILNRSNRAFNLDDAKLVININLTGVLDTVRQFLEHLARSPPQGPDGERGVVVMVASAAAFDGQRGQVSYAASKGAVRSMTLPMARDLARFGIRVVTIAPSLFETRMAAGMNDKTRLGLMNAMEFPPRPGQPEEFAALVKHAVENVMLNGVVIRLDGATRMPSKL